MHHPPAFEGEAPLDPESRSVAEEELALLAPEALLEEPALAQPGDEAALRCALVEEANELGDVGEGTDWAAHASSRKRRSPRPPGQRQGLY